MKTRRAEPVRTKDAGISAASAQRASGETIGHTFRDPSLLDWALTHRSLAYEKSPEGSAHPSRDNEQLEFIGDAVLGLIVAEDLFRRFPDSREGELTRLRATLVSRRHLADVAARMDLGSMLLLGRGEEQSGGRSKPALLSNALEAVIAALYLDGGLEIARSFIDRVIIAPSLPELQLALASGGKFNGAIGDHKSALQEYLQATGAGQPRYVLAAQSGPDHRKTFRVEVRMEGPDGASRSIAESEGTSKKQAQQEAARIGLEHLLGEQSSRDKHSLVDAPRRLRQKPPHSAGPAPKPGASPSRLLPKNAGYRAQAPPSPTATTGEI